MSGLVYTLPYTLTNSCTNDRVTEPITHTHLSWILTAGKLLHGCRHTGQLSCRELVGLRLLCHRLARHSWQKLWPHWSVHGSTCSWEHTAHVRLSSGFSASKFSSCRAGELPVSEAAPPTIPNPPSSPMFSVVEPISPEGSRASWSSTEHIPGSWLSSAILGYDLLSYVNLPNVPGCVLAIMS